MAPGFAAGPFTGHPIFAANDGSSPALYFTFGAVESPVVCTVSMDTESVSAGASGAVTPAPIPAVSPGAAAAAPVSAVAAFGTLSCAEAGSCGPGRPPKNVNIPNAAPATMTAATPCRTLLVSINLSRSCN
jgi:hypothetical protein